MGNLPSAGDNTRSSNTKSARNFRRWLSPTLADCLFIALICWLLMYTASDGAQGLLNDPAGGFFIRSGQAMIEDGAIERTDRFSFSRPGAEFLAWEWLSAVILGALHNWAGLKGVVLFSAVLVSLTVFVVLFQMTVLRANALAALFAIHVCIGASSIHYLARPHLFTYFFLALSVVLLYRDRKKPGWQVWLLLPLTVLWVNLHAGVIALPLSLAILTAGYAAEAVFLRLGEENRFLHVKRCAALTAGTLAACCVNPWGTRLLTYTFTFLTSGGWMKQLIDEHKPPAFGEENALYPEVLIVLTIMLVVELLRRGRFSLALLLAAWTHAALTSIRHAPILAILSGPWLAAEASRLWKNLLDRFPRNSILRSLDDVGADYSKSLGRLSVWSTLFILLLAVAPVNGIWPDDYPAGKVPTAMIARNADLLANSRVFSTDQWGDYLVYHSYPRQKVFIDGRVGSFYGEEFCQDYVRALYGHSDWKDLFRRYGVDAALIPADSGLASVLALSGDWKKLEQEPDAVLFVKSR